MGAVALLRSLHPEASPAEIREQVRLSGRDLARTGHDWLMGAGALHLPTLLATNPARIPRNHRIEEAIAAARRDDFAPFERLVEGLARPFEDDPRYADLERAPEPDEVVTQTFCGT